MELKGSVGSKPIPLAAPSPFRTGYELFATRWRLIETGKVVIGKFMTTVTEIEAAIEKLSSEEQREIAGWLNSRLIAETPAIHAALDEGIRSLGENGGREYTREQLDQKVRQWAGA